jgi:hypothetical protein
MRQNWYIAEKENKEDGKQGIRHYRSKEVFCFGL